MWCGVVWCGVAWCGVVWRGVVWCGVAWCGVVWYRTLRVNVESFTCTGAMEGEEQLQLMLSHVVLVELSYHGTQHHEENILLLPVKPQGVQCAQVTQRRFQNCLATGNIIFTSQSYHMVS